MKLLSLRHVIYNPAMAPQPRQGVRAGRGSAVIATPKQAEAAARRIAVASSMAPADGRKRWAELHLRALQQEGHDDSAWLATFAARLPCGECRRHWLETTAAHPPTWNAYFAWTVAVHNVVNARLSKPAMGLPDAIRYWAAFSG